MIEDPTRRSWLAGIAAAGLAAPLSAQVGTARKSRSLTALEFGAVGDGVADDTAAIQSAIDAATQRSNGSLRIPAGRYRITRPLTLRNCERFDLAGDGASTTLVHEIDEPLLLWPDNVSCRESSIRDLCFASAKAAKSPETATLFCEGGTERSIFSRLLFKNEDAAMGSGIVIDNVADTTTIEHCLMWGPIGGVGIRITRGSEVRIIGGRILGSVDPFRGVNSKSVGIHLAGGNGGVHLVSTDLIGLGTALKIGEEGGTSNREVFLTHATIDSSARGLVQVDNSYTSIVGCWAASCDEEQIYVDEAASGAILSINGGSIFHGGTYGRPGGHHGIVVRAGTFSMSGVNVHHNKGTGLLIGAKAKDYTVNGCRFTDNDTGAVLDGSGYAFTGNVLVRNRKGLITRGATDAQVMANVER